MIASIARRCAAPAALLLAAARPACPQEGVTFKRNVPAVRFTTPPVIDGDLSDPCWQQAAKLDRYLDVLYSTPVKDQTIGYLGYDDHSNGYFSYRRSGYGGTETFFIVGDPNAARFRKRVVIKVVWAR